jgi:general secretion pathway protein C
MDPRAGRLLRRVPKTDGYAVAEYALLALLALQCARLLWAVTAPVGPVGEWKAPSGPSAAAQAMPADFDPFFRLAPQSGPMVVTALNLKLYGVRQDRASGRGSAIVATPDGKQRSYAVGEEILPGVTLTAVDFDNVTISRGGSSEQLFMDQSGEASAVPGPPGPPANIQPPPPPLTVPTVVAPPTPPQMTEPGAPARSPRP